MGQKITEHPQVDYWVKLMREVDKTGSKYHQKWTRKASTSREQEQFGDMQRARTRVVLGNNAAPIQTQVLDTTLCISCGMLIDDMSSAFLRRQVFQADGERVDLYRCASCAGKG